MRITTVTGDIKPDELGLTAMHEHVLCYFDIMEGMPIPPEKLELTPENFAFLRNGGSVFSKECSFNDDVDYMTDELKAFKNNVGGGAICDASPIGLRGKVELLKEASERSGVHLICSTGLYLVNTHPEEFAGKDETYLRERFEKEIEVGIDGTQIKPGFVKCALGTLNEAKTGIDDRELASLRACAKTAAKYGLSLHVHTHGPLTHDMILNAVDIMIKECGISPGKLLMLHMDSFLRTESDLMKYIAEETAVRTISNELALKILEQGINIGYDSWGTPFTSYLPDDYDRMKGLVELLRKGYEAQIVFGHDVLGKAQGITKGSYGYTRFAEFVPFMLKSLGYGDEVIHKLMVENPARILAY